MKTIEDLHIRVVDHGLFLPVARRIARDAGRVSYWTPTEQGFPTVLDRHGEGFPDIERVDCYLQDLDEVDCFVFPDIGFGLIQQDLQARGLPVWGHLGGDILEQDKLLFLNALEEVGLRVPAFDEVKGINALWDYLRDEKDVWVKMSGDRGDWETLHWRSWDEDADELAARDIRLGPSREDRSFYVFPRIDTEIEDGFDTYTVDGKIPSLVVHGMEAKDKAYVGAFQRFQDLPEQVRKVGELFVPLLGRRFGYQGDFSCEVRIVDDDEYYFIDPTCRCGSPPSQVLTEMIGNYTERIWRGANGELIDPEPAAKFGVQALCRFHRDRETWTYVKVDDELDRWVKSANCQFREGMLCLPPNTSGNECQDWLVGIGDTFSEAIRHLKHNIRLLPDGCDCDATQLCELLREIEQAEDCGMEFSSQPVPSPESVVRE